VFVLEKEVEVSEERKKRLLEDVNNTVESLKGMLVGTGNVIMFGFFALSPFFHIILTHSHADEITIWTFIYFLPFFILGSSGVCYFSFLNRLSPKKPSDWLSFGVLVNLFKIIAWISLIVIIGISEDIPTRTFYVFGAILLICIAVTLFEILRFRAFLFFLKEWNLKTD
jgi:hypothetical protein